MLFVAIDLLSWSYLNIFCAIFYGIRTKGGFLLILKILNGTIDFIGKDSVSQNVNFPVFQ